jgi:hypothetical protein
MKIHRIWQKGTYTVDICQFKYTNCLHMHSRILICILHFTGSNTLQDLPSGEITCECESVSSHAHERAVNTSNKTRWCVRKKHLLDSVKCSIRTAQSQYAYWDLELYSVRDNGTWDRIPRDKGDRWWEMSLLPLASCPSWHLFNWAWCLKNPTCNTTEHIPLLRQRLMMPSADMQIVFVMLFLMLSCPRSHPGLWSHQIVGNRTGMHILNLKWYSQPT